MFGQQPYVYQQPIYNQPPMQPMQDVPMRPQYQPAPQMPYPQQPQQQNQSIIWIPNEKAASDFIVAPNNAVTLWDMNAPVVYVKKADASGKPDMKTYDLVERVATPSVPQNTPSAEYVSRRDFDDLAVRVAALEKQGKENASDEQSVV